jgi:hypothetical protein
MTAGMAHRKKIIGMTLSFSSQPFSDQITLWPDREFLFVRY